jgi:hypothetical protein
MTNTEQVIPFVEPGQKEFLDLIDRFGSSIDERHMPIKKRIAKLISELREDGEDEDVCMFRVLSYFKNKLPLNRFEIEQTTDQESKRRQSEILENLQEHGHEVHIAPRRSNITKKLQDSIIENKELHDLVLSLNTESQTFEQLVIHALKFYKNNRDKC